MRFLGKCFEPIHLARAFNYLAALLREVLDFSRELAPPVQPAVKEQHVEIPGFIT